MRLLRIVLPVFMFHYSIIYDLLIFISIYYLKCDFKREIMDDKKTIVEEAEGEEMPPPAAPTSQEKAEIEKMEEQKLKSKFPGTISVAKKTKDFSKM